MPTAEEIRKEQIRREIARRQGADYAGKPVGGPPAPTIMERVGGAVTDFLRPADDAAQVLTDAITRGYAYRTPEARARVQAARDRMGWRAPVLEVGEGVMEPSGAGLIKYAGKGAKLLKGAARATEGGVQAAVAAHGHGAPLTELPGEFAKGAGITAAISKVANAPLKWLERRRLKAGQTFKNADELAAARAGKYAEVDASGAVYRARDLRALHSTLKNMNLVKGVDDAAINVLKKLDKDWRGKNMTAAELDKAQQLVRQKLVGNPNLKRLGGQMVKSMRQFEEQTPLVEKTVDPSTGRVSYKPTSQDVKTSLKTARQYNAQEEKLGAVSRMERRAQTQQSAGRLNPFGPSLESARIRQAHDLRTRALEGKTKTAPFTKDEMEGVTKLAQGTKRRNIGGAAEHLSWSGKLFPAASAASAFIPGIGPAMGVSGALAATGAEALHRFGQKATNREIEDLQALIRDPAGRGLRSDPATIAAAKDKLAKIMSGGVRAHEARKYGGPR